MVIELSSVRSTPTSLTQRLEPDQIALEDEGNLLGDVGFVGEIFRDDTRTHLRGTINGLVEIACARCLEPVNVDLDVAFDDVFVDSTLEPRDEEIELGGADLDESLVIDGTIDLADVVREQIILALPEMALCREDCRGLCDRCGTNLNLIDCNCKKDEIDPRWAALQNLN